MAPSSDCRDNAVGRCSTGLITEHSKPIWGKSGILAGPVGLGVVFLAIVLLSVAVLPGAAEIADNGAAPSGEETEGGDSLLGLIAKGGPVVVVIGLFSIVAISVAAERFVSLRRNRIIPPNFMHGLSEAFGPSGNDLAAAQNYCERTPSPVSNVIRAGVQRLGRRLEIVEKAVEDAAAREADRMRRGLETLAMVGSVSPLLGLLGTIYGMISAFRAAADEGLGRAEVLATGIYEALVSTAAGLTVAVPTLLLYHFFLGRVERLTEEIEQVGNEFLDQCYEEPTSKSVERTDEAPGVDPAGQWSTPAPDAG